MGKYNGLLESSFAEAIGRASHADFKFHCRSSVGIPANAPQSELAILKECLDFYRANQALVDAAVRNATSFLDTPEGVTHVKALEGSLAGGEFGALSSDVANRIVESDAFIATRAEAKSAHVSMGIGVSGDAFMWWGIAGGAEGMVPLKDGRSRTWHTTRERELPAGLTGGLSLSFWWDYPLSGCIFGLVAQLALGAGFRLMLIRQKTEDSDPGVAINRPKFPIAGFGLQFSLGLVYPIGIGGGYYVGEQKARTRVKDLTLSVKNAGSGGNTITVNTSTSLTVAIGAGIAYSLDAGATVTLGMPYYFSTDDVAAMTITDLPANWSYAASDMNLVLTTSQATDWSAGSSPLEFTIGNVETSGTIDTGTIEYGSVTAQLDTGTETKTTAATLNLAWQQYSAVVSWDATVGADKFFTMPVPPCASKTSCTGTPVTAYCQSSLDVTSLVLATDTDGNDWEFGYQFNYTGDDNTPQIRAVMWQVDTSTVVIANAGSWITPDYSGTTSTALYKGTNGNTTFTITPIYNS